MTTGRRRALLAALALAASIVSACGSGDGAPATTVAATSATAPADSSTSSVSSASTGSTGSTVAAAITSPTATPAPATTAPATAAPTSAGAPTTLGDLLTEDEVAEVERALDELDALLGEIDADLAGAPDP